MNRKAKSKARRVISQEEKDVIAMAKAKVNRIHPFDNVENWLMNDFSTPPWSPDRIAEYQKKLDSAFEAPNGIVLAWSGDRRYGDVFLNEKGDIERKPPLLFAEQKINDKDYIYVSAPRWLLMEVLHGSQLEDGWEEASTVTTPEGIRTRIRPEKPPQYVYQHFKIIAEHDATQLIGETPNCCATMFAMNRVCYGRYREPDERDIAYVGETRKRMNKAGVTQRNDSERNKNVLINGTVMTKHFIQRAKEQQALRVKEYMLENAEAIFGDLPQKIGTTKSYKELEHIFKDAMDRQDEARGIG